MPKLELELNCLMHFVPGEEGVVHVLMPGTGHGNSAGTEPHHAHHASHAAGAEAAPGSPAADPAHEHEHVVRLFFEGYEPTGGLPLEGWALALGGATASADTSLRPVKPHLNGEEIARITEHAGPLPETMVTDAAYPDVVARLELRAGYIGKLSSEAKWKLGSENVVMAYQVVWVIDDISDADVRWTRMGGGPADEPFPSLEALAGEDGVVRLSIFHVTEPGLPPNHVGKLEEHVMREHFKAFYELYESPHVTLPYDPELVGSAARPVAEENKGLALKTYNCAATRGTLATATA